MSGNKYKKTKTPKTCNRRWINTRTEYQWVDGEGYVKVYNEGYWYEGPMALATNPPTRVCNSWAFYDEGTESGSVIIGSIDSNPTKGAIPYDDTFFFRADEEETAGNKALNQSAQLEYRINTGGGYGSWTPVNTTSSVIRTTTTASITDGDTTTRRLGTSYSFQSPNGGFDDGDGIAGTPDSDLQSSGMEWLWSVQMRSADVSEDDLIQLRYTLDGDGTLLDTEPTWPTITAGTQGVNVNLTGETANAADGTLTGSVDADLTGETANAADGTLSSTTDVDLTGETANAADGTLTPSTPTGVAHYPVDYILLREPGLYIPNQKPTGPVKIDWSHPMTVGLQAAFIFSPWNGIIGNPEAGDETTRDLTGNGHDILWQTAPAIGPYSNDTYNEFGYGIKPTAASNHYGWIAAGNIPAAGEDIYAMAWAGIGENAGTGIFTIYGPTGGSTDLQMWHGSAGYQFQPYNCADSPNETVFYNASGTGVIDNRISVAYWNDTANSTQGAYTLKNRTPASFSDTLTSDPLPTTSRKLLFLTDADAEGTEGDGSLGNWHQGVLEYWYCWNRKLSEAEGHSINIDPYQFVVPV